MTKVKGQNLKVKSESGFSLLELLVYMLILTIALAFIAGTFLPLNRGRGKSQARATANTAVIFVMEKLQKDILPTTTVVTPATTGSASSTLVIGAGAGQITYDVSGGAVRRKVGTGVPEVLTPPSVAVDLLSFTKISNTNSILGKTKTSIAINLIARFNSASPDLRYTAVRRTALMLWH